MQRAPAYRLAEIEPYPAHVIAAEGDIAVDTAPDAYRGQPEPRSLNAPADDVGQRRLEAEKSKAGVEPSVEVDIRVVAAHTEQQQHRSRFSAEPNGETPAQGSEVSIFVPCRVHSHSAIGAQRMRHRFPDMSRGRIERGTHQMNGPLVVRAVAIVVLVAIAAGLGVAAYNVGVNVGLNLAVESGQPVPVVPYAYGPYGHGGFGFFGIIFWILGFFLVIGLIRAAFGMGRGGRGGWGRWGGPMGPGGPGGFGGSDRVAEWHRELHRREESASSDAGGTRNAPTA